MVDSSPSRDKSNVVNRLIHRSWGDQTEGRNVRRTMPSLTRDEMHRTGFERCSDRCPDGQSKLCQRRSRNDCDERKSAFDRDPRQGSQRSNGAYRSMEMIPRAGQPGARWFKRHIFGPDADEHIGADILDEPPPSEKFPPLAPSPALHAHQSFFPARPFQRRRLARHPH